MHPKGMDGPHIERLIRVFVNEPGKDSMRSTVRFPTGSEISSGRTFPIGSAIVKEKTRGRGGAVELSTFMVKRNKGYNPKCGDWEFGVIDGPTRKIVERGKIERCIKCHIEKKELDFTFRTYLPSTAKNRR